MLPASLASASVLSVCEANHRFVWRRSSEGHASELTVQLRDYFSHGLCSAGGGRDDVLPSPTAVHGLLGGVGPSHTSQDHQNREEDEP